MGLTRYYKTKKFFCIYLK